MDAYERADEKQDPPAGADLFTEDATHQWGPFGELLRGPAAIGERWAQAFGEAGELELTFDYEVLVVTEDIGIARWMAADRKPPHAAHTFYDGVFAVRLTADELCHEFREWWNTATPGAE
jgi:hypothetical protein